MTTINQRLQSENVGLIFDNPLTSFIGPIAFTGKINFSNVATSTSVLINLLQITPQPSTCIFISMKYATWRNTDSSNTVGELLWRVTCPAVGVATFVLVSNVFNGTGAAGALLSNPVDLGATLLVQIVPIAADPLGMLYEYDVDILSTGTGVLVKQLA
jgi:hypothetical protein